LKLLNTSMLMLEKNTISKVVAKEKENIRENNTEEEKK
jgi:hypothetical protein